MFGSLREKLAAALPALTLCGLVMLAGCGNDRKGEIQAKDPERSFAPLVGLSPKEEWLPISADWFLDRSVLAFAQHPRCGDRKIAAGRALKSQRTVVVDWLLPAGMGKGPYYYKREQYGPRCNIRHPLTYEANQQTRPHDTTDRVRALSPQVGFYLDLMDWARKGPARRAHDDPATVAAPAYVERHSEEVDGQPGLRLTYWMLYGANAPRGQRGPIERLTHEGDWERLDVLLQEGDGDDRYVPRTVRLHTPSRRRDIPWDSLELAPGSSGASHPVLAAAPGHHALSPARRREPCGAANGACLRWRTWTKLVPARKQLWYGFGGAWGSVGDTSSTTGPHGPHGPWPKKGPL
jgi:hypothetical protein